jgi:hypothetical protein
MSNITSKELSENIADCTSETPSFNGKHRLLVTLWRWPASEPRRWCKAKVAEATETTSTVSNEIGILTSTEAAPLMAAPRNMIPRLSRHSPLTYLQAEHWCC